MAAFWFQKRKGDFLDPFKLFRPYGTEPSRKPDLAPDIINISSENKRLLNITIESQ